MKKKVEVICNGYCLPLICPSFLGVIVLTLIIGLVKSPTKKK